MDLSYVLAGIPNPAEVDSDQTRHRLAWRLETRKNRAAERAERKSNVRAQQHTPRPEAFI